MRSKRLEACVVLRPGASFGAWVKIRVLKIQEKEWL